jgi:hypothetical protein
MHPLSDVDVACSWPLQAVEVVHERLPVNQGDTPGRALSPKPHYPHFATLSKLIEGRS